MKPTITLILCVTLFTTGHSQDMYKQVMDYHRKGDFSIGLKSGEITGLTGQYFKAILCSTEKYTNFFAKTYAFDFTLGQETLLFSQNKPYLGQPLKTGAWRGSLNFLYSVYNFSYVNFYLGVGVQGGWHNVQGTGTETQIMGTGINGLVGTEFLLTRIGTRNNPFFVTGFVEAGKYWEVNDGYNRSVVNFGVRFNNWRH